jgi:hypothetical protein
MPVIIGSLHSTPFFISFLSVIFTYLWAVVQHLYKKMEVQTCDHVLLIEEAEEELKPVNEFKN